MQQASFDAFEITLNEFEQATAEQLVSYKIAKGDKETDQQVKERIELMINSDKLKLEAIALVKRLNDKRIKLNLKPW